MDSSSSSSLPFPSSFELLAGIEDIEAGFSGCSTTSPPLLRRPTFRSLLRQSPPNFFYEDLSDDDEPRHFLDSCFLCKQSLLRNRDIFMYRGDTPFCSEICREEQIEIDEAREKNWKIVVKKEKQQKKSTSGVSDSRTIHVRAGAVVAG